MPIARVARQLRDRLLHSARQVAMAASVAAAAAMALPARAATPPNVILILVDDLGYGDLGAFGGRRAPTPNIDARAAAGVRFTDAYVTAAVCAPSRSALLSGRHQARSGFEFNPVGRDDQTGLPRSETTISQVMKSAGYDTAIIGKWILKLDRWASAVPKAPATRSSSPPPRRTCANSPSSSRRRAW